MRVRRNSDRDLINNIQSIALEPDDFLWIVRKQTDIAYSQIDQNLCADTVLAQIAGETELLVCLDRFQAIFLKLVSLDLGRQADSSSLLSHVNQDTSALALDLLQGSVQLVAAIAAARTEHISGQTLAMYSNQRWICGRHRSGGQRQMMDVVPDGSIEIQTKVTRACRRPNFLLFNDQLFSDTPVRDQIFDRADLKPKFLFKGEEFR